MLEKLYEKIGRTTRMISAENPTGKKNMGCRDKIDPSDKRLYWSKNAIKDEYKVCPFIRIEPNETVVIADYEGMGVINYLFLTSDRANFDELMLRIYFDNETNPSVNVPMGMFFCMGGNKKHTVSSLPIVVCPHTGCNSYFEMPFKKHFKIEIENTMDSMTWILAYKVMFTEEKVASNVPYFKAEYRKTITSEENPTHILLDNVNGKGLYVGTYMFWHQLEPRWWGEGEVKFYLDDDEYPSIADNGTEDYFGGAWNFGAYGIIPGSNGEVYNTSFLGQPYVEHNGEVDNYYSMYRFHILDSIGFNKNIKVTVDTIGWKEDHSSYKHTTEEVSSVVYYYLQEKGGK